MAVAYNPLFKRWLDLFVASLALLCLSPFFVFISIFICIETKGSPFFIQERIGRAMKPFRLIKFRTMTWEKDASKGRFEPGDNGRVTKFGKLLRDTKIDELPELMNVIRGDMSLVGPRPEVARYVKIYSDKFEKILQIRPGLSDFASIKYRDEEQILAGKNNPENFYQTVILPDKLESAKRYLTAISPRTDLFVMTHTLKRIFRV